MASIRPARKRSRKGGDPEADTPESASSNAGDGSSPEAKGRVNRWEIRVFLGRDPLTDKNIQISRTFTGSRRAAERFAHELEAEYAGMGIGAVERTVATALDEWQKAHRNWARLTKRDNASRADLVCNDKRFGGIRLDRLSRQDVNAWVDRMVKAGVPDGSISNRVAAVRSAINHAVQEGHLRHHPFPNFKLRLEKRERPPKLKDGVVKATLAESAKHSPVRHLQVRLSCVAAVRRSEAAALKWTSLEGNSLSVTGQVYVVSSEPKDGGRRTSVRHIDVFLKSDASYRDIELDDETVRLWHEAYESMEHPSVYVFGEGDEIPSPDRPYRVWQHALRDAEQTPIRLHATRHWSASEALAAGRSTVDVAQRLGNQPATVSRVYSHATKESKQATADVLGSKVDALDVDPEESAD